MIFQYNKYNLINNYIPTPGEDIVISDHLYGFGIDYSNILLDIIEKHKWNNKILLQYIIDEKLKNRYKSINIQFSLDLQDSVILSSLDSYYVHPELKYKNFICSFNGSPHVGRKLLVAILEKFKYFNPDYCSKNFAHGTDAIDGHIVDYGGERDNFYRKFFISNNSEEFFQTINSFGHVQYEHNKNIYNLENKLTQSFLHIVSETIATSYYPFVTEKFLYSIVTRGLFLSYAQPGWHAHIEKYYGFKLYTKLFDYRFDSITNPVERLVELMTMVGKFSKLTPFEWHGLYLIEQDNIEFNYDHYFSGNYLNVLKEFDE